jgi:uncharacterized protein YdbL (DUF1318 family)
MTMRTLLIAALALATALLTAQPGRADEREELKKRFKQRIEALEKHMDAGRIGETYKGYVGFVKDEYAEDEKLADLVEAENDDRERLYELIAGQEGTSPERVARRAAKRQFETAEPGDWLKGSDGKWFQKPKGNG